MMSSLPHKEISVKMWSPDDDARRGGAYQCGKIAGDLSTTNELQPWASLTRQPVVLLQPKNWAKTDARPAEAAPNLDWIVCALTAGLAIFLSWLTVAKLVDSLPTSWLTDRPFESPTFFSKPTSDNETTDQKRKPPVTSIGEKNKSQSLHFPLVLLWQSAATWQTLRQVVPLSLSSQKPACHCDFFKKISNAHQSPKTDRLSVYKIPPVRIIQRSCRL